MNKVGLWQVIGKKLERIEESEVDLEQLLEEWIQFDPSLVQPGLVIVGRQLEVEGGRLDLLALDPQGRWAIIEIKRGTLRRETVAQALDYASSIAALSEEDLRAKLQPFLSIYRIDLDQLLEERDAQSALDPEQRELTLFIVGTGRASGLDRLGTFLAAKYSLPISVISFDVFKLANGQRILAREITEPEVATPEAKPTKVSVAGVVKLAERSGIGPLFKQFLAAAEELSLYPRPYRTSVMFTSPANHSRMLFTIWGQGKDGSVKMYLGWEPFTEFFPVSERLVKKHLGPQGWRMMKPREVGTFLTGLRMLFEEIRERETSGP